MIVEKFPYISMTQIMSHHSDPNRLVSIATRKDGTLFRITYNLKHEVIEVEQIYELPLS